MVFVEEQVFLEYFLSKRELNWIRQVRIPILYNNYMRIPAFPIIIIDITMYIVCLG